MNTATMNGKLDSLLDGLEGVKDNGGGQYSACCPAHEDGRASLSVKVTDGEPAKIILYCHAGCETKDILAKVNMTVAELFADNPAATNGKPRIVAAYDYCDELGELLFQSVRYQPKDFRQRQPDDGGGWNWSTKGARRIVYRLQGIVSSKVSWPVFVAEGEKDADRLHSEGLVATCNVGGAKKWRAEDTKCIEGRHVVILPDNDEPGRKHAQSVAKQCHGTAASVKVLQLPDLPNKGDVSDWLDAGHSAEELNALAKSAEAWQPVAAESPTWEPGGDDPAVGSGGNQITDIGNGKRFVANYGDRVRYSFDWKKWFWFDGTRWAIDASGEVLRLAKDTAAGIYVEASKADDQKEAKQLAAWAHASQSRTRQIAMLDMARSEKPIPVDFRLLDADGWLLNCANRTVNLTNGEAQRHNPGDLITKTTHVEYPVGRTADATLWMKFLQTIFDGDNDLIGFVQRLFGSALVGEQIEHLLVILHGDGANGKSVFTSSIQSAMGDYACTAAPSLLMAKRSDKHPTELADLFGRRLAIVSETRDGQRLDEGLVKSITGGDKIKARRMHEDFWEFTPSHLPVIATNHKPVIQGTDNGIWRRLRLIPFNVTIPDEEQDKRLTEKLRRELPSILKWLVQGCLDWSANGLQEPACVMAATEAYKDESDTFGRWLDDCCVIDPGSRWKAGAAIASYEHWCIDFGEKPMSGKKFSKKIQLGFTRSERTRSGYYYSGIRGLDDIGEPT